MPDNKQISEFLRIIANASITSVGYALGGKMGSDFMEGIFINLTSSVIESGATKLKEQWLSGALNPDIQQALTRAVTTALENVEKRYIASTDAISKQDKEYINNLFKELNEEAKNAFQAATEKEVKDFIYGEPEIAAKKIWERISHTNIFEDTHQCKWFKDYFIKYFFSEMLLSFCEELKTDNKAWRAFQRMLLEGIQADVKNLQVGQDLTQKKLEDLEKLDEIKEKLELLKELIDQRQPDEPFQKGLENGVKQMNEHFKSFDIIIRKIDETTCTTEAKVNQIKDIACETKEIVSRMEKKLEEKLHKEGQELLEIIIKNYTSQIPYYDPKMKAFVTNNRADELTMALTYLQNHRILLLSGIGGVGKTTLARALIETRSADVPLPFWFDFNMNMNAALGDVLEKLAGYMNTPDIAEFRAKRREAILDDITKLTAELQKREQLWLVFDNLETILDENRKFHNEGMDMLFTSLRGSMHNAKIIVTSRFMPLLNNGDILIDALDEKLEIKGLKLDFAVDFLAKNGLNGVKQGQLEEMANGVDRHPLALKLLINLVKKFGVSDMLKDLSVFQKHKEETIMKAKKLFEKLATDEKELLENISVFRIPGSMDAIKVMFTKRTSKDTVDKLIDKSLLETDHKGKYWLHPFVREYSYPNLTNKIEIHKLAYQYYLSFPLPINCTRKEDVQPLIEAHYHACMAKEYDYAAHIIFDKKLHETLYVWGNFKELVEIYLMMLPKDPSKDKPLLSYMKAHACVLGNLGKAYHSLGSLKKAIEVYEKALDIAKEIGNRKIECEQLGNIGNVYRVMGEARKSIRYYEKAIDIAKEIKDRKCEGIWSGSLGIDYRLLGDIDNAFKYLYKALDISKEFGDERNESHWLTDIGLVHRDLGNMKEAFDYYEKALKITQHNDIRREGFLYGELGFAYLSFNEVERAEDYYNKALKIAQDIGDRSNESKWLGNLGIVSDSRGKAQEAIVFYEKALRIATEIENRRFESRWLGYLGTVLQKGKKYREALACYLVDRDIRIRIDDSNLKTIESNLSKLKDDLGENEFEKLIKEVEPRAEEIVKKMLE